MQILCKCRKAKIPRECHDEYLRDTRYTAAGREKEEGRRSQRETALSCEQLVEWQNEETNQLGVQGEKQRETEWEGEREVERRERGYME